MPDDLELGLERIPWPRVLLMWRRKSVRSSSVWN